MSSRGRCSCGRFVFELQGSVPESADPAGAREPGGDGTLAASLPDGALPGRSLLQVPRERLHLLSSEEKVGAYTLGARIIGHRFCGACGTHLYGEAVDAAGQALAYVNRWCLTRGDGQEADTVEAA